MTEANANDLVAICGDCLTVLPDVMAEKDLFLHTGHTGVCKMCGGPTLVIHRGEIENVRDKRKSGRPVT